MLSKYKMKIFLKKGIDLELETDFIEKNELNKRIHKVLNSKAKIVYKKGSVELKFCSKDIKKVTYVLLEV